MVVVVAAVVVLLAVPFFPRVSSSPTTCSAPAPGAALLDPVPPAAAAFARGRGGSGRRRGGDTPLLPDRRAAVALLAAQHTLGAAPPPLVAPQAAEEVGQVRVPHLFFSSCQGAAVRSFAKSVLHVSASRARDHFREKQRHASSHTRISHFSGCLERSQRSSKGHSRREGSGSRGCGHGAIAEGRYPSSSRNPCRSAGRDGAQASCQFPQGFNAGALCFVDPMSSGPIWGALSLIGSPFPPPVFSTKNTMRSRRRNLVSYLQEPNNCVFLQNCVFG